MEDAATAEICRAQVWQWLHHKSKLSDGRTISVDMINTLIDEESEKNRLAVGNERYANGKFKMASTLFHQLVTQTEFVDFLTIPAYEQL
jgi:malate synthase